MKLQKKIQRKINQKLGYTNGGAIDTNKYDKLCKELAQDIILTIEQDWNKRKSAHNLEDGKQ